MKTLGSKEIRASKKATVTHNSVFAAHRLQCRMTIRKIDIRHFVWLKTADYADVTDWGAHAPRTLVKASAPSRTFGMGLTGLEPVTLRLSSACSNQLSYRPGNRELSTIDAPLSTRHVQRRGGKGIRTPDFQLAKLALYQLSYAPKLKCPDVEVRLNLMLSQMLAMIFFP